LKEIIVSSEHSLTLQVRDYECDLQGVVNNAVYMNYLEHARHEFLKSRGIDFAEVTRRGVHLVIVRAEMDFKASLTSGDSFEVRTRYQQESRLRFVFYQDIFRQSDQALMLSAAMTATALNERGRPFEPRDILSLLE
jgi:acyl-CoA thioester hydrolase